MSFTNIRSSGYGSRKCKENNFPLSPQPKSIYRPKQWSDEVEEAHRFQLAGYRDARDYQCCIKGEIERWPESGYVKKLQRKDGTFYYYNRSRECADKDVNRTKIYAY